jgi:Protein of unknown function (DUF1203)
MGQRTFRVEALPEERLATIRRTGVDDAGNEVGPPRQANGGEPLRCCLRYAKPSESILLIAYRPFDADGPYAETGPVFVHANRCGGYAGDDYPDAFRDRPQVLRCYDQTGTVIGGRLSEPGGDVEALIEQLLSEPRVDRIHTRNVVFGCYMSQIRRRQHDSPAVSVPSG